MPHIIKARSLTATSSQRNRNGGYRETPGWLVLLVILALVQFGVRVIGLLKFPVFIDEPGHIRLAQGVLAGNLIAGAADGKLLVPILLAFLHPTGPGQLFIVRAATALVSVLSFGLVYRLTATFAGRTAGLLAALLYIVSPYLFFYERLALIDTYMMTFGLLVIWAASQRSYHRQRWLTALLCGLALAGGLAAKATGAVLLVIPLCAFVLDFQRQHWRAYWRWLVVCYGTFIAIWLPVYGLLRWRHVDYFGLAQMFSNAVSSINIGQRLLGSLSNIVQIDITYFSAGVLLVIFILAIIWFRRDKQRSVYIILTCILPITGIMFFAPRPRYLIYHVPLLIIIAAAGAESLRQTINARANQSPRQALWRWGAAALVSLGALSLAIVAIPFYATAQTNPAGLALTASDTVEYISSDSAGFVLPEIAAFVAQQTNKIEQPVQVIGLLSNCAGLKLYVTKTPLITLDCPILAWDGGNQSALAAVVNRAGNHYPTPLFVIVEKLSYVSLDGITVPMQPVGVFTRPESNSQLTVYRVAQPLSF